MEMPCHGSHFRAGSFVTLTFQPDPQVHAGVQETHTTKEVTGKVRILQLLTKDMSRQQLQDAYGLRQKDHFRETYLLPVLQVGLFEMTTSNKPSSRTQRYRLTAPG